MFKRSLFTLLAVVAGTGCGQSADTSQPEALAVSYTGIADPGFIDQTVTLLPSGSDAVVPTIDYEPLDADGNPISGVEVVTAFGSDRGLLIVPPGGFVDVLTFAGTDVSQVVDVRATVLSAEPVVGFGNPTIEDPQPTLDGAEVTNSDVFNELRFRNDGGAGVNLRVVCLVYDDPAPGRSQQATEITEVVSRTEVKAGAVQSTAVAPEFAQRSEQLGYGCASLKAHATP